LRRLAADAVTAIVAAVFERIHDEWFEWLKNGCSFYRKITMNLSKKMKSMIRAFQKW
jgi:hypothetical protein